MPRPPRVRPERTYSLTASLNDVTVWCLQRPAGTVWRVSRTVDGVWRHLDFGSELEARQTAGIPALEEVA